MSKQKLAIVSTFDDLCGIASYTKAIVEQLSPYYEIKVFDLDQFLLSNIKSDIVKLANQDIDNICKEIARDFDVVNIQLEHGTLGKKPNIIFKRLKKIILASPKLCITFHTVLQSESGIDWRSIRLYAKKLELNKVRSHLNHIRNSTYLTDQIYDLIRQQQKLGKDISIIVHTKRDARYMSVIQKLKNVYHHPLVFLSKQTSEKVKNEASKKNFPALANLSEDTILLGCFGFYGVYKGTETAINALKLLPSNYHLAIFGGVHPNNINKHELINNDVKRILETIAVGKTELDVATSISDKAQNVTFELDGKWMNEAVNKPHKDDLSSRVHFAGAPTDEDFPKAMAICDIVLLPYNEVGQSASGPGSMAIDMGKHIVASRTKTFLQLSRYYPEAMDFFDIGNSLQLAQVLEGIDVKNPRAKKEYNYNTESNVNLYRSALFSKDI